MRKLSTISTIAAAFAIMSCSMIEEQEIAPRQEKAVITSVSATLCDEDATRTIRNADYSIWWLPNDEINVFYGGSSARFTSTNTVNAARTNFSGQLTAVIGGAENSNDVNYFYGLYPYDSEAYVTDGMVVTSLKSQQLGVVNTFADDTNITLARSENTGLGFYNLCGGIKFSLTHPGIKSITVTGNNDEIIAGKVKVQFEGNTPVVNSVIDGSKSITLTPNTGDTFEVGKYYFVVVLPTVFTNGLTITLEGQEETGVYTRTSSTTVKRSTFGVLTNLDKNVTYQGPASQEPVMFSISRTLSGCTLTSDIYQVEEGEAYSAGVVLDEGYDSISSYSIVMNGTEHNEYFDASQNTISIPAVTGDVFIDITAHKAGPYYPAPSILEAKVDGLAARILMTDVVAEVNDDLGRYYTAQLRVKNGATVIDCVNFQCTYSSLYGVGGANINIPAGLTFAGLNANTVYECRFSANVPGRTAEWSEWFEFKSGSSATTSDSRGNSVIDFNEIKGYGMGDFLGMTVSTYPGATVVTEHLSSLSGYSDWCERLGQTGADVVSIASYRVGDSGSMSAINSSNPVNSSINGVAEQTYCFGRPGYIQLGTTSKQGTLKIDARTGSESTAEYKVRFQACVYGSDSDTEVTVSFDGTNSASGAYTDTKIVTVKAGTDANDDAMRSREWKTYEVTVGSAEASSGKWTSGSITLKTDGQIRVFIDNITITRN